VLYPAPHLEIKERVAVTGVGILTSFGPGWSINAEGFRAGNPAFREVTLFDVSQQRARKAAEIDLPPDPEIPNLTKQQIKRLDRAALMLLLAAQEAWTHAGWKDVAQLPVVLGTTSGGMNSGQDYYQQAIHHPLAFRNQASRLSQYHCQRQPLELANAFGFGGPITLIANACASGSNAVGHAAELIRNGAARQVLTGGYDALSHLVFSGFDSLQALSTTVCRPFDSARDGLALGEGAAILTLESFTFAKKRGAKILAEIAGYGASTDCHHLTQPQPNGDAAFESMRLAALQAGINPGQVDYINAHGTGTMLNDSAETEAINRWAGEAAPGIKVSSTKGSIGHCLGAAGAIEAALCVMVLQEQWLPPSPATTNPAAECRFQYIRRPGTAACEYVLSNSFGFGGANASLIFRRTV